MTRKGKKKSAAPKAAAPKVSARPNSRARRRQRRRGARAMPALPAAAAFSAHKRKPTYGSTARGLTITHAEPLTLTAQANASHLVWTFAINPGLSTGASTVRPGPWTWLPAAASAFDEYVLLGLEIYYEPTVGSTTEGNVTIWWDPDTADGAPSADQQGATDSRTHEYSVTAPPYQRTSLYVDLRRHYSARGGHVPILKTRSHDLVSTTQFQAYSSYADYDLGQLGILQSNVNDTGEPYGLYFVRYHVELLTPTPDDEVGALMAKTGAAGTSTVSTASTANGDPFAGHMPCGPQFATGQIDPYSPYSQQVPAPTDTVAKQAFSFYGRFATDGTWTIPTVLVNSRYLPPMYESLKSYVRVLLYSDDMPFLGPYNAIPSIGLSGDAVVAINAIRDFASDSFGFMDITIEATAGFAALAALYPTFGGFAHSVLMPTAPPNWAAPPGARQAEHALTLLATGISAVNASAPNKDFERAAADWFVAARADLTARQADASTYDGITFPDVAAFIDAMPERLVRHCRPFLESVRARPPRYNHRTRLFEAYDFGAPGEPFGYRCPVEPPMHPVLEDAPAPRAE